MTYFSIFLQIISEYIFIIMNKYFNSSFGRFGNYYIIFIRKTPYTILIAQK